MFTLKRQGVEPQSRKLTVFFKDDVLERFEGDAMPSEAEFVATLDVRPQAGQGAGAGSHRRKPEEVPGGAAARRRDAAVQLPPLPASYPPLEAPGR